MGSTGKNSRWRRRVQARNQLLPLILSRQHIRARHGRGRAGGHSRSVPVHAARAIRAYSSSLGCIKWLATTGVLHRDLQQTRFIRKWPRGRWVGGPARKLAGGP